MLTFKKKKKSPIHNRLEKEERKSTVGKCVKKGRFGDDQPDNMMMERYHCISILKFSFLTGNCFKAVGMGSGAGGQFFLTSC